jgi:hypothetical protein
LAIGIYDLGFTIYRRDCKGAKNQIAGWFVLFWAKRRLCPAKSNDGAAQRPCRCHFGLDMPIYLFDNNLLLQVELFPGGDACPARNRQMTRQ